MVSTKSVIAVLLVAIISQNSVSTASISETTNRAYKLALGVNKSLLNIFTEGETSVAEIIASIKKTAAELVATVQKIFASGFSSHCENVNVEVTNVFTAVIHGASLCFVGKYTVIKDLLKNMYPKYKEESTKALATFEEFTTCRFSKCFANIKSKLTSAVDLFEQYQKDISSKRATISNGFDNFITCLRSNFAKFTTDGEALAKTLDSCAAT